MVCRPIETRIVDEGLYRHAYWKSHMSIADRISSTHGRITTGEASESEALLVASECLKHGHPFDALLLLDRAIRRYPTSETLRAEISTLLRRMEEKKLLDRLVVGGPAADDRMRQIKAKVTERMTLHHGPEGRRPSTTHFLQCVILKNLCQSIPQRQPIWDLLLRICEYHGRRAAEEALGGLVEMPVVQKDQTIDLPIGDHPVRYRISNGQTLFELLYFFAFEPGMVRWIAGFDQSDVFVDIGANIGKYSILAAVTRGCRTYAIEPFTPNFEELLKNLALNGIEQKVEARRWAVSDRTGEGRLFYEKDVIGAAVQSFDEPLVHAGEQDQKTETLQGYRLDDLIADGSIAFPQHVKIDVDGTEHRVIAGMKKTIADPRLKSIRLEIRLDDSKNKAALAFLEEHSFSCAVDDDEKNMLCVRR